MDVEVFNLVTTLASCDHIQKLPQTVLLQVLLGQVLQVSLWKGNAGSNWHLAGVAWHVDLVSKVSDLALDFDSSSQVLSEVVGVENLILDGLGTVNGEVVADFFLLGNFLTHG